MTVTIGGDPYPYIGWNDIWTKKCTTFPVPAGAHQGLNQYEACWYDIQDFIEKGKVSKDNNGELNLPIPPNRILKSWITAKEFESIKPILFEHEACWRYQVKDGSGFWCLSLTIVQLRFVIK